MSEEARLEFEIHGGYHYLKVRCAPELVERLRDWVECGRFRFEPTHDGSAVLVVDTEHASGRLARPKEESSAAVPVGDGVTVNATDLLAVLDAGLPFGSRAYMPIVEARDRLRAALNGEGTE